MLPQNRFRADNLRHFLQRSSAQSFGGQSQADAFGISEPNSAPNLMTEDSILSREVLISCQERFIDRTRDVREQTLPVHRLKLNQLTSKSTTPPFRNCVRIDTFEWLDHPAARTVMVGALLTLSSRNPFHSLSPRKA